MISVANFIEGRSDHTWVSSKGKLFDLMRKGVGARQRVSAQQYATLQEFAKSEITAAAVAAKSKAASVLVMYLDAMLRL